VSSAVSLSFSASSRQLLGGGRRLPAVWVLLGAPSWVFARCACVCCATLSSPKQPRLSTWCQGGLPRPRLAPAIARCAVLCVFGLWLVLVCVCPLWRPDLACLLPPVPVYVVWFCFHGPVPSFWGPPGGPACRLAGWPAGPPGLYLWLACWAVGGAHPPRASLRQIFRGFSASPGALWRRAAGGRAARGAWVSLHVCFLCCLVPSSSSATKRGRCVLLSPCFP